MYLPLPILVPTGDEKHCDKLFLTLYLFLIYEYNVAVSRVPKAHITKVKKKTAKEALRITKVNMRVRLSIRVGGSGGVWSRGGKWSANPGRYFPKCTLEDHPSRLHTRRTSYARLNTPRCPRLHVNLTSLSRVEPLPASLPHAHSRPQLDV